MNKETLPEVFLWAILGPFIFFSLSTYYDGFSFTLMNASLIFSIIILSIIILTDANHAKNEVGE